MTHLTTNQIRADSTIKTVEIAIVGKYTTQSDTYTSIIKALEHAGFEANRKVIIRVRKATTTTAPSK